MKQPHQNRNQFFFEKLFLLIFISICLPSISNAQPSLQTCIDNTTKTFRPYNFNTKTLTAMCICVKDRNQGKWPTEKEWDSTDRNTHTLLAFDCGKTRITAHHAEILEESMTPGLKKRGFTTDEIQKVSACAAPAAYSLVLNMEARKKPQPIEEDRQTVLAKIRQCQSKFGK